MVREINAPVVGFLDDPHPNRWSGDQFTAVEMVINNSSAPISNVSMQVTLRLNGRTLTPSAVLSPRKWLQERNTTPVGYYHICYQSGKTTRIPLFPGKNISDWWSVSRDVATNAAIGWIRARKDNIVVGLNIFEWSNPVPDDPITSISLESRKETVLGLVGVTAELQ